MNYFASWMFTTSYNAKNSPCNFRPTASHEFARFLHDAESRSLPLTSAPQPQRLDDALQSTPDQAFAFLLLEQLTAQILEVFDQVRSERDATPRSSADWQKLTGEMLAYARVTALLQNMKCGPNFASRSDD
jgi:hypothetical protein